jgi:alkanesulfonate monooxygenase SsuD/methylene tetrahydromethanopterin reductase-like flavin-dependent oxidoreductase (luciferase family)
MTMLGMRFDLRVPDFAPVTTAEQYQTCLEMADWADRLGFDFLALSEHHASPDGYLPAPIPLAAAILGRTGRIGVNIAAVLLVLHDPIRVAEELAVVDLFAPGRITVTAGLGYRAVEFEMAGVDKKQRGKLLEEYVGVLRQAWTGEPFEWRGRTIQVTPKPATPGGPMILMGGGSEAAARRAARLHCGFFPSLGDQAIADAYWDECAKVGFDAGFCNLPSGPAFYMVSDDPDKTWSEIGPNVEHDVKMYASWQAGEQRSSIDVPGAETWQDVRASGVYRVLTPEETVALAKEQGALMLHPLMGGITPELAWRSLELVEQKVLPQLRPAS